MIRNLFIVASSVDVLLVSMENSTCNSNLEVDMEEDEWLQAGRQVQQEKRTRNHDNTELR